MSKIVYWIPKKLFIEKRTDFLLTIFECPTQLKILQNDLLSFLLLFISKIYRDLSKSLKKLFKNDKRWKRSDWVIRIWVRGQLIWIVRIRRWLVVGGIRKIRKFILIHRRDIKVENRTEILTLLMQITKEIPMNISLKNDHQVKQHLHKSHLKWV